MWRPDDDEKTGPEEVRSHYFIVAVTLREDGSYEWNVDNELGIFDVARPVYLWNEQEFVRLYDDFIEFDEQVRDDLIQRLKKGKELL